MKKMAAVGKEMAETMASVVSFLSPLIKIRRETMKKKNTRKALVFIGVFVCVALCG